MPFLLIAHLSTRVVFKHTTELFRLVLFPTMFSFWPCFLPVTPPTLMLGCLVSCFCIPSHVIFTYDLLEITQGSPRTMWPWLRNNGSYMFGKQDRQSAGREKSGLGQREKRVCRSQSTGKYSEIFPTCAFWERQLQTKTSMRKKEQQQLQLALNGCAPSGWALLLASFLLNGLIISLYWLSCIWGSTKSSHWWRGREWPLKAFIEPPKGWCLPQSSFMGRDI